MFISVLAYHFVHTLRLQLKARGNDDSGETLGETLATQQRVTALLQRRDGRSSHVRKATCPVPQNHKVNEILGLAPTPAEPIACWSDAVNAADDTWLDTVGKELCQTRRKIDLSY